MHEERSKMRYSKTFSCGVIGPLPKRVHVAGQVSPPETASTTWKSLNSTRPHWLFEAALTGVLNVYWNGRLPLPGVP